MSLNLKGAYKFHQVEKRQREDQREKVPLQAQRPERQQIWGMASGSWCLQVEVTVKEWPVIKVGSEEVGRS